jgi:hypothetical protein
VTAFRLRLAPVLCAAVAVAVGGCGGSSGGSSDSAKVKQTIENAFTALANGNGSGFCSLATSGGQATLAKALPGSSCAKVVALVSKHLSAQQKTGLRHAQVGKVTISGAHATVKSSDISTSQGTLKGFLSSSDKPTTLTKQSDGSWKLSNTA